MNLETSPAGNLRQPARSREVPMPPPRQTTEAAPNAENRESARTQGGPAFHWQRFDAQNPADRVPILRNAVSILEDAQQSETEKQRAIEALKSIGYGWDRTFSEQDNLTVLKGAILHEKGRERTRQEQLANTEAFQKYYRENIERYETPRQEVSSEARAAAPEGRSTYRTAPQPAPATPQKQSGLRGFFAKAKAGFSSLFRRG